MKNKKKKNRSMVDEKLGNERPAFPANRQCCPCFGLQRLGATSKGIHLHCVGGKYRDEFVQILSGDFYKGIVICKPCRKEASFLYPRGVSLTCRNPCLKNIPPLPPPRSLAVLWFAFNRTYVVRLPLHETQTNVSRTRATLTQRRFRRLENVLVLQLA